MPRHDESTFLHLLSELYTKSGPKRVTVAFKKLKSKNSDDNVHDLLVRASANASNRKSKRKLSVVVPKADVDAFRESLKGVMLLAFRSGLTEPTKKKNKKTKKK